MADMKYGRLFTEDDVMAFAFLMSGIQPDGPDGLREKLRQCETTFPADEPLFLLRGQDRAAAGTAACYLPTARERGASEEHIAAAHTAIVAMEDWQAANPERVKIPD